MSWLATTLDGMDTTLPVAASCFRLKSSAISQAEYNANSRTPTIWFVESGGPYDYTAYRRIYTKG